MFPGGFEVEEKAACFVVAYRYLRQEASVAPVELVEKFYGMAWKVED